MQVAGPNQKGTRYLNEQGQVGVLVSPGYGAGWSSWNSNEDGTSQEELLFDPGLIALVLENTPTEALVKYAENRWGGEGKYVSTYGLRDITVVWVAAGHPFRISEYDGSESITMIEHLDVVVP